MNNLLKKSGNNDIQAFITAVKNNDFATVTNMLENSKNPKELVNTQDEDGKTALMWAAHNGRIHQVEYLINHGAKIDTKDKWGLTALFWATTNGSVPIIDLLLNKGQQVDMKGQLGRTILMHAAYHGDQKVLQHLINIYHANVNIRSNEGETALLVAAKEGHIGIVQELLKHSADIHAKNNKGQTALMLAAQAGHQHIVELLRKSLKENLPSPKSVVDENGIKSFLNSIGEHTEEELLIFLDTCTTPQERSSLINASDQDGNTALLLAAKFGHTKLVKYLIAAGANVNATGKHHQTALIEAAKFGHIEIVAQLLKQPNIDVNVKEENDTTALMYAAANGHSEIVAQLLKCPTIKINEKDKFGCTALMLAAKNGDAAVVQMLLYNDKTDVSIKNTKEQTAFMLAAKNGNERIVELLLTRTNLAKTSVTIKEDADIYNALDVAIKNNKINVVRKIIHYINTAASIQVLHHQLFLAAKINNPEITKILLNYINPERLNQEEIKDFLKQNFLSLSPEIKQLLSPATTNTLATQKPSDKTPRRSRRLDDMIPSKQPDNHHFDDHTTQFINTHTHSKHSSSRRSKN